MVKMNEINSFYILLMECKSHILSNVCRTYYDRTYTMSVRDSMKKVTSSNDYYTR